MVVSRTDVRLNLVEEPNEVYVLDLAGGDAAGGRGGGFGQRNVTRVYGFRVSKGGWNKRVDVSGGSALEGFEPPHYATLMPIILEDGSEVTVAGAVDPDLVAEYEDRFRNDR